LEDGHNPESKLLFKLSPKLGNKQDKGKPFLISLIKQFQLFTGI
jgi:hypothetical protein